MTTVTSSPIELARHLKVRPEGRSHWRVRIEGRDSFSKPVQVDVPVVVLTAPAAGPTLLLTGGVHGNEYEGPAALMKLAADQTLRLERGRLVIAPSVNPLALAARVRRSPQDGLDLNRSFPGNPNGSITQAIAAFMANTLTPAADAVFDLHAGGEDSWIIPSVMLHFLPDRAQMQTTLSLGLAFGAPATLVYDEVNPGLFDTHVESRGIPFICCEMGGAGMLTAESLAFTDAGIRRVMAAMRLTKDSLKASESPFPGWRDWSQPKVLCTPDDAALPRALHSGYLRPLVEIGQRVAAGSIVGQVHDPSTPWDPPTAIITAVGGIVYSRHTGGMVQAGETIAIIGDELVTDHLLDSLMQIALTSTVANAETQF
jgi:N2-acetyl-L-2,4-diaminobutanoate deacetylase